MNLNKGQTTYVTKLEEFNKILVDSTKDVSIFF